MWAWLVSMAFAGVTVEDVAAAAAESEPYRAMRIIRGAPAPNADLFERLAKGEVITQLLTHEEEGPKKAWGIAVVPQPIGRLWAAVNDDAARAEYTKVEVAIRLTGESCRSGRKVFQYLPIPMITNRWWIANYVENVGLRRRSSGRVREMAIKATFDLADITDAQARSYVEKGMPIAFSDSSWLLTDIGGDHTLVEFYSWTDPGGSLPKAATNLFAEGSLKDTIRSMERLAADGPSCPSD